MLGGAVLLRERRPCGELRARDLSVHRTGDIGRKRKVVVLVHARDGAVAVDAQEVQAHAEVVRHEVRHAHACRLVRDAERVAEILDGEIAVLLGLLQESHGGGLGHETARRVVVDLEPLPQEVRVIGGSLVLQEPVRHGLQGHRPQTVAAGDRRRRQIDATVLEIGDRTRGGGEVVDVDQLEADLLGHDAHRAMREGAGGVARRLQLLLGEPLDVGQVVVQRPHAQALLGVRAPGLFGGRDRLPLAALQLAVQAQDRLDRLVAHALGHAHGFDAETAEDRPALRTFEFDLERRAPVRWFRGEELTDIHPGRRRDRLQQRQLRLPLAVLDEAQVASGHTDLLAQFVQGHPVAHPLVSDAVAQGRQFQRRRVHSLSIAKEMQKIRS